MLRNREFPKQNYTSAKGGGKYLHFTFRFSIFFNKHLPATPLPARRFALAGGRSGMKALRQCRYAANIGVVYTG